MVGVGNLLYRGKFNGSATGVKLSVQGSVLIFSLSGLDRVLMDWFRGYGFGFSAFLNGVFIGSGVGNGVDLVNATYTFPVGAVVKTNVVTVVVDHMGKYISNVWV